MTECSAFLAQARSDFRVFGLLDKQLRSEVPGCHPLHYLQMAAEKLAKAVYLAANIDFQKFGHVAFSNLPHNLKRRDIAGKLGWIEFKAYRRFLTRSSPVFRSIDELHPSVGPQQAGGGTSSGPNVEYPWLGRSGPDSSVGPCRRKRSFNYSIRFALRAMLATFLHCSRLF